MVKLSAINSWHSKKTNGFLIKKVRFYYNGIDFHLQF